jgi:SpoVK/Ycf46/Vps4 family AAA+-type ATPase
VFDVAEAGGAILLFDEADALFGTRGEVRDSLDRHANMEIAYLLQRVETYRGLAILTTNMKQSVDPALLRRIRFIVNFPFPDAQARSQIWRRVFPPQMPRDGLDVERPARLRPARPRFRTSTSRRPTSRPRPTRSSRPNGTREILRFRST